MSKLKLSKSVTEELGYRMTDAAESEIRDPKGAQVASSIRSKLRDGNSDYTPVELEYIRDELEYVINVTEEDHIPNAFDGSERMPLLALARSARLTVAKIKEMQSKV